MSITCGLCKTDTNRECTIIARLVNNDWLLWGGFPSPIDCDYYLLSAQKSTIPDSLLTMAQEMEKKFISEGKIPYIVGVNLCSDCLHDIKTLCIYLGEYGTMGSDGYSMEEKLDDYICKAISQFNKNFDFKHETKPFECFGDNFHYLKWQLQAPELSDAKINEIFRSNRQKSWTNPRKLQKIAQLKAENFVKKAISKIERKYPVRKEKFSFKDYWDRISCVGSGMLNSKLSFEDLKFLANYPFLYPVAHPELFQT